MSNEHESSAGLGKIARDPDDDLKEALHELPYGMYVIGSSDGATPNAMIADWVMQVSFNPRLISVSYEIDSSTLARIRKHKFFTVNLLNQENNGMALAAKFVQPTDSAKIKGRQGDGPAQKMNKLDGIDYWLSDTAVGCPILENALVRIKESEIANPWYVIPQHAVALLLILIYGSLSGADFIYFQFS